MLASSIADEFVGTGPVESVRDPPWVAGIDSLLANVDQVSHLHTSHPGWALQIRTCQVSDEGSFHLGG